jgi:uncharacterized membrane protein YkoI
VPVRRAADARIKGGEVNDVEREVRNGRVTYGIGYKGPNGTGPQRELVLDESGAVLRGKRERSSAASSSLPAPVITSTPSTPEVVSNRLISYQEVPENVRNVAAKHMNYGAVERVNRLFQNGETEYDIWFKKDNGEYQEMVIAEDGRIVSNRLVDSSAVGSPGLTQSGTGSGANNVASAYSSIRSPVQLSNSTVIQRGELPVDVWRVVRQQTSGGNITQILRGDWSGKPVYQVSFTDPGKRYVEMQLDSNGQVIYDARNSNNNNDNSNEANLINNLGRALFNQQ